MVPELTLYAVLLVVLVLDCFLGDPRAIPHPVRFIGRLCSIFERFTRENLTVLPLRIRGVIAFFLVLLSSACSLLLIVYLLALIAQEAALLAALAVCYFSLAAGDLLAHSNRVYDRLRTDDLPGARSAVAMLVGRDTESLDTSGVARACVESVSENMVDGIAAPLFWAFAGALSGPFLEVHALIGAAFGATLYKAVNTMDSMYGYKNEKYLEFGWCAARVDDLANFVPARLGGLCLIGAAYLLDFNGRGAALVFKRDRLKSSSPNSGHSEAAAAGALQIELGGPSSYFGRTVHKDYIGAGLGSVVPDDIRRVNRLVVGGSLFFFLLCAVLHFTLTALLR